MSMFLFLQAQSQNPEYDFYDDHAQGDFADAQPSGTGISYVLIAGSDVESHNLNRYVLYGEKTVKPPVVTFGNGVIIDEHAQEEAGQTQSHAESSVPPKIGEMALLMLLSKEEREYVLGDLAEEFALYQSKYGVGFAKVWYYKQVVSSTWPVLRRSVRLGIFVWVGVWLRRHI
jgi:hypothetical protein